MFILILHAENFFYNDIVARRCYTVAELQFLGSPRKLLFGAPTIEKQRFL